MPDDSQTPYPLVHHQASIPDFFFATSSEPLTINLVVDRVTFRTSGLVGFLESALWLYLR
ncbi:MAG: hypothetical protein KatS3mg111_1852 [Pirellulaceae bacterium]|nr:MAG: hypothetical protein KatS3mg111_1852 [Pirellulaceae bacterium]